MTTQHPNRAVLSSYLEGALRPDELLATDDHLAECAECRRSIGDSGVAIRRFAEALGGEHLTYQAMERHVDGLSTPDERAMVAGHVDFCDACRRELDDLARLVDVPRRGKEWWAFLVAAAAAVVIAVIALREPRPTAPTAVPGARVPGGVNVTTTRPPVPAAPADAFATLDPSLRQVAVSLESGTLVSAELLASLRGTSEQQRTADGPQDRVPRLLAPMGTVVESDQPLFRWSRPAAVRVQIFDRDYQLVAESPRLEGTSWQPPLPLGRGATYQWQLAVREADGEETIAPLPPAVAARFRVLDGQAFDALTAARASGATLEAGLISMRAGLVEEGATMLSRYAEAHPESARAARLAEKARAAAAGVKANP